jgi:hypothetical protein
MSAEQTFSDRVSFAIANINRLLKEKEEKTKEILIEKLKQILEEVLEVFNKVILFLIEKEDNYYNQTKIELLTQLILLAEEYSSNILECEKNINTLNTILQKIKKENFHIIEPSQELSTASPEILTSNDSLLAEYTPRIENQKLNEKMIIGIYSNARNIENFISHIASYCSN